MSDDWLSQCYQCMKGKHNWCLGLRGISKCDCPECVSSMDRNRNPITFAELIQ